MKIDDLLRHMNIQDLWVEKETERQREGGWEGNREREKKNIFRGR